MLQDELHKVVSEKNETLANYAALQTKFDALKDELKNENDRIKFFCKELQARFDLLKDFHRSEIEKNITKLDYENLQKLDAMLKDFEETKKEVNQSHFHDETEDKQKTFRAEAVRIISMYVTQISNIRKIRKEMTKLRNQIIVLRRAFHLADKRNSWFTERSDDEIIELYKLEMKLKFKIPRNFKQEDRECTLQKLWNIRDKITEMEERYLDSLFNNDLALMSSQQESTETEFHDIMRTGYELLKTGCGQKKLFSQNWFT